MPKKIRQVRTFARTAAKSVEKKLIDNAKRLREEPYLILPDYKDKYSEKIFNKIKKNINKIIKFKDDINKLEKLSNKKGLTAALAGTLQLAKSEKAPYLGVAKYSTGEITYAQRGKADKEKLIGVQHFDDPVYRLLSIKDIAQKRKLNIFSWDEGFISTGIESTPPKEFIDFIIKKLELNYKKQIAHCNDLKPEIVKNKKRISKNYLILNWISANLVIAICENCAKIKKNTIFEITKYILIPSIAKSFSFDIISQVEKQKEFGFDQIQNIDEYLSGKIGDFELIQKNLKKIEESIKESKEKILILDGVSYGKNVIDFVEKLNPNKYEKEGLVFILERVNEPVVLNNITPNKVLEKYWKDYGLNAINSVIDNDEMAKKFFELNETPSAIFELIYDYKQRQEILSQLPKYKSLPKIANFVDNVVKSYKTFGETEAISEIKKRPDDPKGKSISYAFLLAIGKGEDKKWQYSKIEIEYGEYLKNFAEKLLKSEPNKYHDNFKKLLSESGSTENVDKYLI